MDLWRELGGRPPEKDVVEVLAQARSNDPTMGTGADAFARACADRVTAESAVARVAFSTLATSAPADVETPGFSVAMPDAPRPHARKEMKSTAEVTHRRTGESKSIAFSASYDGKAAFVCRMPNKRLDLEDLDQEPRQGLLLHALVRMADATRDTTNCRLFLDVVQKLAPCTPGEQTMLEGLLARVLGTYLYQGLQQGNDYVDWSLARDLASRASATKATDDWHHVQETVWEHLDALREKHMAVPQALHDLATQLELPTPPEPAAKSR
jgi:hypothetical protein